MLAPDVRFEGFTATDWQRVRELFRWEGSIRDRSPSRPAGGIIALHVGGCLCKLLHTQDGRLGLDELASDWPLSAAQLARRHAAQWAVIVEDDALGEAMEHFGAAALPGDDWLRQSLQLARHVQQQAKQGRVEAWPWPLHRIPIPTPALAERVMDTLLPQGTVAVLGAFERERLWTAVAVRRGPRGIDWVLGPEPLRSRMEPLTGQLRVDHARLTRAVGECMGALSFGCSAALPAGRRPPEVGGWAAAAVRGSVVLGPCPAWVAIPLGLDAVWGAVRALRAWLRTRGP